MSFSIFDLILITGIIQGLIASGLMISGRQFQPHQRLLGLVVLVFVLVNFRMLNYSLGWDSIFLMRFLPLGLELFLPPLLYFYLCLITSVGKLISPSYMKHLWLPLAWLSFDLIVYLATSIQPTQSAQNEMAGFLKYQPVNVIEDKLILLSTWFYLILGSRRYMAFNREMNQLDHQKSHVLNRWILQILIWMVILSLFLLVNNILDYLDTLVDNRRQRWMFFNVYLAMTTYYLGFLGVRLQSPKLYEAIQSIKIHQNKSQALNQHELEQQLHQYLITEKHFQNSSLNSQQVAKDLGISAESLSFYLNRKLKTTFRDLLNQYRIKDIQSKLLKQDINTQLTSSSILDMALASGFNSQASFYRAFKKFVGSTPRQFIDTHQHKD